MTRLIALLLLLATPVAASDWPPNLIDPATIRDAGAAADLILPMPCGGGMAFQRVNVPVDIARPLADRPFRMGQSDAATAFSDYLMPTHLRGAFDDPEAGMSYYFIARYEMNEAQYRAITGDCDAPFTPIEGRAKGGLSWFDAVDLGRRYTEWVLQNVPDAMPTQGDRAGFLRLPTEPEWEYAVRGGARADPSTFAARRFFSEGSLTEYAVYLAPGQGRTSISVMAGPRKPNPLGLYDVYGNVEELMLEPFRLNAVGRSHGQPGGLVTRGGSADLEDAQITTARRNEYPLFNSFNGSALASEFFGARFVISAIVVSEGRFNTLAENWQAEADRPVDDGADPLATLAALLEEEVDPRRGDALSGLQLEFRLAREQTAASLLEAAKSTLLSGAAFVELLNDLTQEIATLQRDVGIMIDRVPITLGEERVALLGAIRVNVERLESQRSSSDTFLLSYRTALETLSDDIDEETRTRANDALTLDLAAQEQTQLAATLARFWEDLAQFAQTPDMDVAALRALAVD
jgi:formylglycine-generating enzyme required for sulfatase activity